MKNAGPAVAGSSGNEVPAPLGQAASTAVGGLFVAGFIYVLFFVL